MSIRAYAAVDKESIARPIIAGIKFGGRLLRIRHRIENVVHDR